VPVVHTERLANLASEDRSGRTAFCRVAKASVVKEDLMFGFRSTRRSASAGTLAGSNLRKAMIAGVGMLALRWWRNRQASSRVANSADPTSSSGAGQTTGSDGV
jgi:hypothetical protein